MSVANPWIDESPAPAMSHSLEGFPVLQFSSTISFANGPSQGANTGPTRFDESSPPNKTVFETRSLAGAQNERFAALAVVDVINKSVRMKTVVNALPKMEGSK